MVAGGKHLAAHFGRSDAVAQGCRNQSEKLRLRPLFDHWQHLRPDHNPQILVTLPRPPARGVRTAHG